MGGGQGGTGPPPNKIIGGPAPPNKIIGGPAPPNNPMALVYFYVILLLIIPRSVFVFIWYKIHKPITLLRPYSS